jgi:hypothetical protein
MVSVCTASAGGFPHQRPHSHRAKRQRHFRDEVNHGEDGEFKLIQERHGEGGGHGWLVCPGRSEEDRYSQHSSYAVQTKVRPANAST